MEEKNIVSSPNIRDVDALFVYYQNMPSNGASIPEDFKVFLSVNTVDRQMFLNKYCNYEFVQIRKRTVLKYSLKV